MKRCFLITTYCNTDKKVEMLSKCIDNLRNISNDDICIHAHYPLNLNIQNKVDHYLYDFSNPIVRFPDKYLYFWRIYGDIKMGICKDDYGYAALQQWKRGVEYLRALDYDEVFIINYDAFITQKLYSNIISKLNTFVGVVFHFDKQINLTMAAFNIIDNLFDGIEKQDYIDRQGFAEDYMGIILSPYKLYHYQPDEYSNDFFTTMDVVGDKTFMESGLPRGNSPFDPFTFDNFKIHIGETEDDRGNRLDDFKIFIFDINDMLDIEIKNGDDIICKKYRYIYKQLMVNTTISYNDFLNNKTNLTVKINNKDISDDILSLFKDNCTLQKIKR